MSATTTAIEAPEMPGNFLTLPVAAATSIPAGAMVAVNSSGNAVNAADTAGLTVLGRCEADADNSSGSAGDISVKIKRGIFGWQNSGSAAVDADDIGKEVFVEDNQTVAESSTNSVVAGAVHTIENGLVYVDTRGNAPVTQVTLASTNGTAGAAADLAALKAEAEKIGDDLRAIHAALVAHGLLRA